MTPTAGLPGVLDFSDTAVTICSKHTGTARPLQTLHLTTKLSILLLQFEDTCNTRKVNAFFLAHLLRFNELLHVSQGVAASAAFSTLRNNQSLTVVLPQSLRVNVRKLCGTTNAEHRQIDVETDFVGPIQVSTLLDQRDRAQAVQDLHLT